MIDPSGIDRDRCAVLLASMARVDRIGIYSLHRYESVRRHEPKSKRQRTKRAAAGCCRTRFKGPVDERGMKHRNMDMSS